MTAAYLDTHTAIVGASGAGKTVTAKDQVEELLRAGRHVCILDPTGAWWGMRSNAAGDGPGFDIPIFGGAHGDVPITADQGEAIGAIVAGRVSAIIDISGLRTGSEQRRFARDLCRRLRAKPDGNFHFVVDEADEFAAQKPRDDYGFQAGEELMWMAKRGRLPGFVLTLITQRPASIDKEVLSQAQTLIVHQLLAPVDQKPIVDYLKEHADRATLTAIKSSLASLDRGERWIYSPRLAILERGMSPMPSTFDSSKTIGPGEAAVEPKMLASIDLGEIRAMLAPPKSDSQNATDGATDNNRLTDHAACNRRIAALEAERDEWIIERGVGQQQLDEIAADRDQWKAKAEHLDACITNAVRALGYRDIEEIGRDLDEKRFNENLPPARVPDPAPEPAKPAPARLPARPAPPARGSTGEHPPRWQRIMDAIAWTHLLLASSAVDRNVVAWFAGVSPKSSGYQNDLSAMRTRGLIDYPGSGLLALADEGKALANWPATPPTKDDLLEAIKARLEPRFCRMLDALWSGKVAVTREAFAGRLGLSPNSSGFQNDLSKLRTLGLIDYPQQGMVGLGRVLAP